MADEEITARVNDHKQIKDDIRERRRLVGTLKRSEGLAGPDPFAGDVTKALAEAGLFRLRAVLIGSVAFSCYPGLLGVRMPSTAMQTGVADYAQDFAISSEVGDSLPPYWTFFSRSIRDSGPFRIRRTRPRWWLLPTERATGSSSSPEIEDRTIMRANPHPCRPSAAHRRKF